MHCMTTAPFAVFLELYAIRIILLVLRSRVVASLAFRTGQRYLSAHLCSFKNFIYAVSDHAHEPDEHN